MKINIVKTPLGIFTEENGDFSSRRTCAVLLVAAGIIFPFVVLFKGFAFSAWFSALVFSPSVIFLFVAGYITKEITAENIQSIILTVKKGKNENVL